MTTSQIWFTWGFLLVTFVFLCLSPEFVANRLGAAVLVFAIFALVFSAWLCSIRKAQFSPHWITNSINGHVISGFWVTNPAYVTFRHEWKVSTNGMELLNIPETNYWWHQWQIFRK
jgi:hypothetical protein